MSNPLDAPFLQSSIEVELDGSGEDENDQNESQSGSGSGEDEDEDDESESSQSDQEDTDAYPGYTGDPRLVRTDACIKLAVRRWCKGGVINKKGETAPQKYGAIKEWDTSRVTDMAGLFECQETFNEDISEWDVSNVIEMSVCDCLDHSYLS